MKEFLKSFMYFMGVTIVTGVLYPALITGIGYLFMHEKANGSIVMKEGKPIGSLLIAQSFKEDKYFWPRPSWHNYNPLDSGGSNLALTSHQLKKVVEERGPGPAEMVYASGSGLDPHISIETAKFQVERVAKARKIAPEALLQKLEALREGPLINVLKINLALDDMKNGN